MHARRLVLMLALGSLGCGGTEPPAITWRAPPGSAIAPRVTPVADLAALPRAGAVAAAGVFEPSGLQIPGGLEVTWPLRSPRRAGERLLIAVLDEAARAWRPTGERATVGLSGRDAKGTVYHFSTIAVLDEQGGKEDEGEEGEGEGERGPRIKIPGWKFRTLAPEVSDQRKFNDDAKREAAKLLQQKLGAVGGGSDYRAIGDLFAKHPFAEVEAIAKQKGDKRLVSEADSRKLGAMRREMINQAMGEAIKELDPRGVLTIGMLDSGNKNSGIASDVDQTVFVVPKDVGAHLSPPVDEAAVIRRFNEKFERKFGVTPERMGIESLNGADFYPDWRQKQSVARFVEEADRVVDEKRKNPEAYRSEGQLKSQAEGRGYEALQEHHRRVADLRASEEKIENLSRDPRLSEGERRAQADAETRRLLEKYKEKYPAASLEELRAKLSLDSPWTEVRIDPRTGAPVVSQVEDPKSKVLANQPEFAKRFAFDGAWDNWMMFEHHPHNRRKYLLRSVAEGAGLVRRLPPGKAISTFEYERVYGAGDHAALDRFIDDVYAHRPDEARRKYRRCLDVAARERLRHKGAPNPASGADYSDKEVLREYWPLLSEKEARLYEGMSKEAFEATLKERALRAWEADAREIMIENLLRTAPATAAILDGGLRAEEVARLRATHPHASAEKLAAATRRQLYQGFRDLMSPEYAKYLHAPQGRTPPAHDLVHRLLTQLGHRDRALHAEVLRIAQDAAALRVRTDPGERTFRQEVGAYLHQFVSERIGAAADVYREAKKGFAEGKYTKEYVGEKLLHASVERWGSLKGQVASSFGWDVRNVHMLLPEGGLPRVELEFGPQKWSLKKLATNMACAGNADSVLQVMLAYQEGGREAAAWAAGFELVMNVPGVAQANALKDLVVHKRPEGAVMLGSAMLVPGLGQAFVLISIGKTSVMLLGNAVLQPLHDDDGDKLYQGFLGTENGFRAVQQSQRCNLLHFVPRRVVVVPVTGPDGKTTHCPLWAPYPRPEAEAILGVFPEEHDELGEALGGGEEWEKRIAVANDWVNHPVEYFEAQRASMAYYYRDRFGKGFLEAAVENPEAAMPRLLRFFEERVDDWVKAKGEFAEFPENTLLERRFEDFPAVRQKVAARAAGDLLRSAQIVKAIEDGIAQKVRTHRDGERDFQTGALLTAIDEAWKLASESDLAQALYSIVDARREEGRAPEPRVHAWPSVTQRERDDGETIEFMISVVCDPEAFPPLSYDGDSAVYDIAVDWEIGKKGEREREVKAKVSVFDRNKRQVGPTVEVPIGTGEGPKERSESVELRVSHAGTHEAYDAKKADPRAEMWGGEKVSGRTTSLWICWEGAPGEGKFEYEMAVSGGAHGYEKISKGDAFPSDRFPGEVSPSSRSNLFQLPVEWPEGHVGRFRVKGSIRASGGERFDFDVPFEIPDRREAAEATLVFKHKAFETYDSGKADFWRKKWGDDPLEGGGSLQLHVRWKEVPPGCTYFYDFVTRGGVPAFELKEWGQIEPTDDFPPKPYRSGAGSSAFSIPVQWPTGAGSIAIEGRILALPPKHYPGESWREAKPVAEMAFEKRFDLRSRSRYAEGTYRVGDGTSIYVWVLLGCVQRGARPVAVTMGGKTQHVMSDQSYNSGGPFYGRSGAIHCVVVKMPFGTAPAESATVTFRDFGERVTLDVPLKPEGGAAQQIQGPNEAIRDYERQALAKIARLTEGRAPTPGDCDAIFREYQSMYSHWCPYDQGKAQEYARLCEEYMVRYYTSQLEGTKDPVRHAQLRKVIANCYGMRYWCAVAWGDAGVSGRFSEMVSQVQAAAMEPGDLAAVLTGHYDNHARTLFSLTGDLAAADAAWRQAREHDRNATGVVRFGTPAGEPKSPFEVEEWFR